MHSSNGNRNTEETWFLVEVDVGRLYALYNWSNGLFLSHDNPCTRANSTILGPSEKWSLVSGKPWGFDNAIALKAADDGSFLGAGPPKHDTQCGGEPAAWDKVGIPRDKGWAGWWVFEPADKPEAGKDFWNTVGGYVSAKIDNIVNKITPADVAACCEVVR